MTSDARFTLDDVLNATRKVVEEHGGDFVYVPERHGYSNGCVYAKDGKPSCLVGHVINVLDPDQFEFIAHREDGGTSKTVAELTAYGWMDGNFWTKDAAIAMLAAQNVQDGGGTWGEAQYAAENLGAEAE